MEKWTTYRGRPSSGFDTPGRQQFRFHIANNTHVRGERRGQDKQPGKWCAEVLAIIYSPQKDSITPPTRACSSREEKEKKRRSISSTLHRHGTSSSQLRFSDHDTIGIPIDLADLNLDGVVVERLVKLVGIVGLAFLLADAIPLDGRRREEKVSFSNLGRRSS